MCKQIYSDRIGFDKMLFFMGIDYNLIDKNRKSKKKDILVFFVDNESIEQFDIDSKIRNILYNDKLLNEDDDNFLIINTEIFENTNSEEMLITSSIDIAKKCKSGDIN